MILADKGITPPKEWHHNPTLSDEWGYTVAMTLSSKGITPPKEWLHDPTL